MEFIIDFIGTFIKIAILSSIYALLTLLTFKLIGRFRPNSWLDKVSEKKLRLWILSGLFFSLGLLFFLFSYYGDHGLGDSARVPVGHGRAIQEMDGTQTYIQDEGLVSMLE